MYPERKVYDSDIAVTPLLREVAEIYVREYVGNFDVLIAMKQCLQRDGRLPDGQIRTALNTLRTDPMRTDLWGAVSAVLRHPSTPPPEDMALVIDFDKAQRSSARRARQDAEERKRDQMREVFIPLGQDQFTIHARFATAKYRTKGSVLHWLRPEGHKAEWQLDWHHRNGPGYEEVCRKGGGVQRRFKFTAQAFCRPMFDHGCLLWSERPLESDVWPKGEDRFLPDCRSCLRHIGLEFMDVYPPDRLESGDYPEGWR